MKDRATKITFYSIFINGILFVLKLAAGLISAHLAAISDALNSLLDLVSSSATYYCVKLSRIEADEGHPFGHHRAEPIAGLLIAILTGILSFEIMKAAVERLFQPERPRHSILAIVVLAVSMLTKWVLFRYLSSIGREAHSPAIRASSIDCRNDAVFSFVALVGVAGAATWSVHLENLATFLLSFWILRSGYHIALENIEYLMGKAAPPELVEEIRERATAVPGVHGINDTLTHYVGNYIHVEIHVEVDHAISTRESHDIGKGVQHSIESLPSVDKAFIHIDPV